MDEVTSLLLAKKKHRMSLEKLSKTYLSTFKKQINPKQLGYSSVSEALMRFPNLKVHHSTCMSLYSIII